LTPTEFLAGEYRRAVGVESVPLPTPARSRRCAGTGARSGFRHHGESVGGKRLVFFARLAEEIGNRYPEIAMLVIEHVTAGMVVQAGLLGGFDLRRHLGMMIAGAVPNPRDIFTNTHVLLCRRYGRRRAEWLRKRWLTAFLRWSAIAGDWPKAATARVSCCRFLPV